MVNIDATRPVRGFKVRTLHKHFLTRRDTTYNVIHTTHEKNHLYRGLSRRD